jgi:hypothetical protein
LQKVYSAKKLVGSKKSKYILVVADIGKPGEKAKS